ncbi:phosphoribosyltransferase [Streptomyces sp. ISL-10]|uniref:phosphoribosyltransferase n=1 Tax=Streptomyces sp. ISL-10 TaxID=2819172 RepID=UPI001BEB4D5D|nr:phosphoribosyltransferase family protein [Streptomyces sp. ISL-10]MBT2366004.1 phosphoribosyltransferase [Streptomyces sp. ISL-10]
MRFRDRRAAGRELAALLVERLREERLRAPYVLALPRGGVPVADEIARALGAPLDVVVARKIGAPFNPELGVGALAGEDPPLFDARTMAMLDLTADRLGAQVAAERTELHRCEDLYRGRRPAPALHERTAVVVADGLATGVTARAAVHVVRGMDPAEIVLAVPVCSKESAAVLRAEVDDLVCLHTPEAFHSVAQWYEDFGQVSDEEVIGILRAATSAGPRASAR